MRVDLETLNYGPDCNCEAQKKFKAMDEEYHRGFNHGMQLAALIIIIVVNLIYWNL